MAWIMAVKKASKYKFQDVYSCGHQCRLTVMAYSEEDAKQKAKYKFQDVCPECAKAQLEETRAKKAEKAKNTALKNNWATLKGTEKQIAWAEQIRLDFSKINIDKIDLSVVGIYVLNKFLKKRNQKVSVKRYDEIKENAKNALNTMLETETKANFYIDCRAMTESTDFLRMLTKYFKTEEQEMLEDIQKDLTLTPTDFNHKTVTIKLNKNTILILSEKDDDVIKIAKSLYYRWDNERRKWFRTIEECNGRIEDRIAELTYKLMKKSFAVCLDIDLEQFEEVKEKTTEASYKEEIERYISYKNGKLKIDWLGYDNTLYYKVRKIFTAKYIDKSFFVDISQANQVLDFADENGFEIQPLALQKIEEYHEKLREKERLELKEKIKNKKYSVQEDGVLDDLRDDD